MTVTNWARRIITYNIAGSGMPVPTYFIIGSGSGTVATTDTALFGALDRQLFTSTTTGTVQKVSWQGDWNSVELSGLTIKEFGVIPSGTLLTGSIWSHATFPGILFDGSNELRVEENWEVF